ncbi:MAG: tetratricopeptide repeat protein, partial [Myxococcota bacterium]
ALARLYQRTESWERAVDVLTAHARLDGSADLWHRAGRLITEHLAELREGRPHGDGAATGDGGDAGAGDPAGDAERYLEKALELDPEHRDAMLALAELARARSRWASAVELLTRAEGHTSNRLERIELLSQAAEILDQQLERPDDALELYQRVFDIDPDNVDVAQRLADKQIASERWAEAIPILTMLARKIEDDRPRARVEIQLGEAHTALGEHDKAAQHYERACAGDGDSLEAALGLANAHYHLAEAAGVPDRDSKDKGGASERWGEVERDYRGILDRHQSALADGRAVTVWYRVGRAAQRLDADDKADAAFRRALELDPIHSPALAALIEVSTARGDWHTVIENKRVQIDATLGQDEYDGAARLDLLSEIGDIYHRHLSDLSGAVGAYREALDIEPHSPTLLHKALDIYTEQGDWMQAVATLDTLAENDTSARRRA